MARSAILTRRNRALFGWLPALLFLLDAIALVAILIVGMGGIIFPPRSRLLLLEAGAALAQYPEIVIGELEIIFGVDPITLHLGIARESLVFFEELGRVAASAIIDPVAAILAAIRTIWPRRTLSPATAATAAVLPIIDQLSDVLVTRGIGSPLPFPGPSRSHSGAPPPNRQDARRLWRGRPKGPHPPYVMVAEATVALEVVTSGWSALASGARDGP